MEQKGNINNSRKMQQTQKFECIVVFNNLGAARGLFLRQSRAEVVLSDGEWRGSGIFKRAHVVTARLDERSLGLL